MSEPDFNLEELSEWLRETTGEVAAIELAPMRGGGSCEMFDLARNGQRWVIRRAPLTAVSDTAHNVVREYKIINALQGGEVRVPETLAVCDQPEVLGAPFYIMRYIDGEVIRRKLPTRYIESPPTQGAIGEELIDALVELHAFDWRNSPMAELAKNGNFLDRQVERWMGQLEGYRHRELPAIDDVASWLESHRPSSGELTVMHGDYKIDNVFFSKTIPPTILSLVDFEMTTVGDPLVDLAWAMIFWPEEGNTLAIAAPGSEGGMSADYCQAPTLLVQRYAEKTGRDMADFQWYQVFAAWKLAIVLEASYARHLSGESKNPMHSFFGTVVDELVKRARRLAD